MSTGYKAFFESRGNQTLSVLDGRLFPGPVTIESLYCAFRDRIAAERGQDDAAEGKLRTCPFCGGSPFMVIREGFPTVSHSNPDCPISPVEGWSVSVWQTRR